MKRILILLFPLLLSAPVEAQIMTHQLERHINSLTLSLIEDYEHELLLLETTGRDASFLDLFKSPAAPVYCDFMNSEDYGKVIPASKYAAFAITEVHSPGVVLKNVVKDKIRYRDGSWKTRVRMNKSQEFMDSADTTAVLFSSSEFYDGVDYDLVMTVSYIESEDRCVIESIEGGIQSDRQFPVGFYQVIGKNETSTEQLYSDGRPIRYNSFGQAFTTGKVVPRNDDIALRKHTVAENDRYEFVWYEFIPRYFRARARFGFTLGSAYYINTSNPSLKTDSKASELGIDLGVVMAHTGPLSWSINSGIAYSMSSIDMEWDNAEYSYEAADASKAGYTRSYHVSSATEGIRYSDLAVPLYFSLEAGVTRYFRLTLDAGVKGYYNWKTTVVPYHVRGTVTGRSRFDNFDLIDTDFTRFLDPGSYARRTWDLSAVGSAGLDLKIYGILYVYGKASYEYGIFQTFPKSKDTILKEWMNTQAGEYPLVYNPNMGEEVATRSFIQGISFSRRALWLNFGLMVKF